MDTLTQQYFVKLSLLPEDVQHYFDSEISGKFLRELEKKYSTQMGYMADLVVDIVVNDFHIEVIEDRARKDFKFDDQRVKNFIIDFLGIVLYPVHEYLEEMSVDVAGEIVKRGGSVEEYNKYEEEWADALGNEFIEAIEEFSSKQSDLVDFKNEENILLNMLEKNFLRVLKDNNINSVSLLNSGLLAVMNNVQGFRKEAIDALLRNSEKMTSRDFFLEDKMQAPTCGNWLKDFIAQYGSGDFDSLVLSEFLSKSKNVEKLDAPEKDLIEKLLIIYRNIKFFIPSEDINSPEELYIIPVSIEAEEPIKSKAGILDRFYKCGNEKWVKAPIDIQKNDNDTANQVLDAYRGDVAREAKVAGFADEMKKKFGQDNKAIRGEFFIAVRNGDVEKTVAILRILAEMSDIENMLAEDEKLNKFLASAS